MFPCSLTKKKHVQDRHTHLSYVWLYIPSISYPTKTISQTHMYIYIYIYNYIYNIDMYCIYIYISIAISESLAKKNTHIHCLIIYHLSPVNLPHLCIHVNFRENGAYFPKLQSHKRENDDKLINHQNSNHITGKMVITCPVRCVFFQYIFQANLKHMYGCSPIFGLCRTSLFTRVSTQSSLP